LLAAWLRGFHAEARKGQEANGGGVSRALEFLEQSTFAALDHISRSGRSPLSSCLNGILQRYFRKVFDRSEWETFPTGRIHGDFIPGNMIVERSGRMRIFDFGDTRDGFLIEDVARFCYSLREIAGCGWRRKVVFRAAAHGFLEAYADAGAAFANSAAFQALSLWNALIRLREYTSGVSAEGLSTKIIQRRLAMRAVHALRSVECESTT